MSKSACGIIVVFLRRSSSLLWVRVYETKERNTHTHIHTNEQVIGDEIGKCYYTSSALFVDD